MKRHLVITALLLAGLCSGQAVAQDTAVALVEQQYGSVAYLSGGIGDEERDAIRAREPDFNLRLLFAERDGSYLAGVDVQLVNAKGETVFAAQATGPFLLLRLPAGRYGIKLSANGQARQGTVTIAVRGRQQAVFRW